MKTNTKRSSLYPALAAAMLATFAMGTGACSKEAPAAGEASAAAPAKDEKKLPYIDMAVKLAADLPEGWGAKKQICLLTDKSSETGVSEFKGCLVWAIGKKDDKGNIGLLDERLKVYAVPQATTADFDQKKDSDTIKSSVTAGDYVVYTNASKPDDPGTQTVISSLKHQP